MVSIPDEILEATPISDKELRMEIAMLLYRRGLPIGKAAAFAGMDRVDFGRHLAGKQVDRLYEPADLEHDVQVLEGLLRTGRRKANER